MRIDVLEGVHCVCFVCDEACFLIHSGFTLPVPPMCPQWAKGVGNDWREWSCHNPAPRKFCVFEFVLACRFVYVCILNSSVHSTAVVCSVTCQELCEKLGMQWDLQKRSSFSGRASDRYFKENKVVQGGRECWKCCLTWVDYLRLRWHFSKVLQEPKEWGLDTEKMANAKALRLNVLGTFEEAKDGQCG